MFPPTLFTYDDDDDDDDDENPLEAGPVLTLTFSSTEPSDLVIRVTVRVTHWPFSTDVDVEEDVDTVRAPPRLLEPELELVLVLVLVRVTVEVVPPPPEVALAKALECVDMGSSKSRKTSRKILSAKLRSAKPKEKGKL